MKSLNVTKKAISISVGFFLLFWMQNVIASSVLSGMRIGQTEDKTRIVFDLKQANKYQVSQLSNPSRLVIDFYNTANYLSFKRKHITDNRLFKIRVSENKKRVRVVLDLHKTPQYESFLLAKNSKGKERLVLDLFDKKQKVVKAKQSAKPVVAKSTLKAKVEVPKSAVASKSQKITKQTVGKVADVKSNNSSSATIVATKSTVKKSEVVKKTPQQSKVTTKKAPVKSLLKPQKNVKPLVNLIKKTDSKPLIDKPTQQLLNQDSKVLAEQTQLVIAIDAGHGGKDTGAIGHNKVYEKQATLLMAKQLKKMIDRQPGMKAVLTREKDVFIPLSKRVKIAKQKQADLFISIHADAFHDKSVRGGSVYVLSERGASSTMAKLLAKSENAALQDIRLNGMDDDVAFALSDLSREANIKASRKLAATVLKEMKKTVKMHKHSVQSAGFAVLKSIDMPSLLIETAFISNPSEARNLMSRKFQKQMASAIANGLASYRKQTAPKQQWGETLYVHYKVQRGDTLSQIAQAYQVSTLTLKKVNNIKNANALYVGKKLKIPVSEKMVAGL